MKHGAVLELLSDSRVIHWVRFYKQNLRSVFDQFGVQLKEQLHCLSVLFLLHPSPVPLPR